MFSRVVEGADPYRGIEKPFFSSPPKGCANITREEQAPPLPRSMETVCLCKAERQCEQRYGQSRTPVPTGFERNRLFLCRRKIARTTHGTTSSASRDKQPNLTAENNLSHRRGDSRIVRFPNEQRKTNETPTSYRRGASQISYK